MDWASRPKAFTEDMRQPVRPQTGESGDERGGIVETRQSRGSSTAKPQAIMPLSKPAGSKEGDGRGELGPHLHRVLSAPRVKVQRRGGATLWLMDEEAAAVGVPIAMRAFMLRQFKGVSQLLVKEVLGFQRQFRRVSCFPAPQVSAALNMHRVCQYECPCHDRPLRTLTMLNFQVSYIIYAKLYL
jgi:hypothetical protein